MADSADPVDLEHSHLQALFNDLIPASNGYKPIIIANAENVYMIRVRALWELARSMGTRVVLVTFLQDFDQHDPLGITIRVYNEYLREYGAQAGIPVVDLEARFKDTPDKKDYFFDDHFHPSLKGAEFIAQGLAEAWRAEWLEPLK